MRVADWIADYLYNIGVNRVHGLMGGGAAGLNDGFIKHYGMEYVCYHHEQGAGHAAIGESKYTGKLAVVNPTTGCGGTNCVTSVLNAWQDGVPVLFLSGNVRHDNTAHWLKTYKDVTVRHYGAQEHHIIDTVKSITKVAGFISQPENVEYMMHMAVDQATRGRPGPVWIDVPSNIQAAQMPEHNSLEYVSRKPSRVTFDHLKLTSQLRLAERPIVVAGVGLRQAGCHLAFIRLVEKYQLPFVTTYGAQDYAPFDHPLNMGTVGVRGSRAGNFAMQNADTLLILGTSMGATVIGYDPKQFNPNAYKIYVDIQRGELDKDIIPIDEKLEVPLDQFFGAML
jgi:acetolactate synthase I/II/III large subunit